MKKKRVIKKNKADEKANDNTPKKTASAKVKMEDIELDAKKKGQQVIKTKSGVMTVSDPRAFPTGAPEGDIRIQKAMADNRWVSIGDFSEEWHKVAIGIINGLTTMGKVFPAPSTASTGGVKVDGEGKEIPVDDAVMFFNALDTQVSRMAALKKYFDTFEILLDNQPARKDFAEDFEKIYDKMESMGRKSIMECRDDMVKWMESAGFKFKTEKVSFIGEKLVFDTELFYVGKKIVPKEDGGLQEVAKDEIKPESKEPTP